MTRVEETPVANIPPPHEQERLPEPQRQQELLHHLCTEQLADVPPGFLRDPRSRTRPFVGLVADVDKVWQVFLGRFSLIEFIRTFVGFLAALAALLATLNSLPGIDLALLWTALRDAWGPTLAVLAFPTWLSLLFPLVLPSLVVLVIFVVVLFLLGRLSLTRDAAILDLNCLYFAGATGPEYVWWRNVIEVSPQRKSWIRVRQEDGVDLLLRVPQADRCWLVKVMRQLLRHHHRDLYGTISANEAPGPTEPHPELPEIRHSHPQLRDRYAAFVAERDQVFAAMPDDMMDADKRREFAEFLRWLNIRS